MIPKAEAKYEYKQEMIEYSFQQKQLVRLNKENYITNSGSSRRSLRATMAIINAFSIIFDP